MPLPRVTIEARAVDDPSLRFSASGVAVCSLRLVSSDRRKNPQTQEWEDGDQLWIDATCFKVLAEHVAESVAKGDLLLVHGKLRTESWESREGEKRSKISMIVDTIGPSLQFRTVPHGARVERTQSSTPDDPWASPSQTEDPPF